MSETNLNSILKSLERAIEMWFVAKQEHDKAYAEYEDHSWDYHGSHYIDAMDDARKEYRRLFALAVAQQIKEMK